ncbi:hypothetical protein LTR70_001627 [Exophiala xenobiotica]|uniref:Uncharacterized protein n=1 Tax=Lithohypha guttulata TaxID=1690604 RepID=A0ABR0K7N9_9EURO|nr:hypothetical protein LTR24_006131 [Lithohypha guttulata]KAK5327153.1 hypothetical protein LTR70_001627 [Exophiala xenobiotica]
MPPKIDKSENEDHLFLLSCLHNADTPDWQDVATLNGIADSASLPAKKSAQRKFKRIVDASGKYKLENGKVVLKDGDGLTSTSTSTPSTPTPTTPVSGKKRGRKAAAAGASSNKKAKKADDADTGEGVRKEGYGGDGDEAEAEAEAGEDAV